MGGGNPDKTAFVTCENPITPVLQPGQEMEGGYWVINSQIKETTKEEITSPTYSVVFEAA